MHWYAQVKPTSYIHKMWASAHRRSSYINWVLFKTDDTGVYQSDELPEDKIEWFRIRPHIFNMICTGIPTVTESEIDAVLDMTHKPSPSTEVIRSALKEMKKVHEVRKRPVLKE